MIKKETSAYEAEHQNAEAEPSVSPLFAVCVLRVVFVLHTIEVIEESKMCLLFRSFWVFSAVSVSGKWCLRIQRGWG